MTTQATHTPGPWTANDDGLVLGNLDNYEGEAPLVCACGESDDFNMEPGLHLANARLIAAAPELLEALQFICNGIGGGGDAPEAVLIKWKRRAVDAIAKAEGRAGQ